MSVILKPTKVKYKDPDSKQYVGINAISDDTAENVIGNWLDNHPEATTTVQDGSISHNKLSTSLLSDINAAKAAINGVLVAENTSQMTQENTAYVYTGTQSGYTAGKWYYKVGNTIKEGGTYQGTVPVVDETLTINGAAADAAAVGEVAGELSNILDVTAENLNVNLEGGYLDTDGHDVNSQLSNYSRTPYVNVANYHAVKISASGTAFNHNNVALFFFDENKSKIFVENTVPFNTKITVPNAAVYFRFFSSVSALGTYNGLYGDESSYDTMKADITKLSDKLDDVQGKISILHENLNITLEGGLINNNGQDVNSQLSNYSRTPLVYVNNYNAVEIVTSGKEFKHNDVALFFFNKDKEVISTDTTVPFNAKITIPDNTVYFRFFSSVSALGTYEGLYGDITLEKSLSYKTGDFVERTYGFEYGYLLEGEVQPTPAFFTSDYIPLYGSSITIKLNGVSFKSHYKAKNTDVGAIHLYDSEKKYLRHESVLYYDRETVFDSDVKYIRFFDSADANLESITAIHRWSNILESKFQNIVMLEDKYAGYFDNIPAKIDFTVGMRSNIYLDGLIADKNFANEWVNVISTTIPIADESITISPAAEKTDHVIAFQVQDKLHDVLVDRRAIVRCNGKHGDGSTKRIMICGDSLIGNGESASWVFNKLREDGDYNIIQVGSKSSTDSIDSSRTVKHEGRGSWSWATYIDPAYESTPLYGSTNTFMHNGALDFSNYINTYNDGNPIDIVIVSLGTNDMGQGGWETAAQREQKAENAVANAKVFIDALLQACPNCKIALGLPSFGAVTRHLAQEDGLIASMSEYAKYMVNEFDDGKYNANVTCVCHGAYIDRYNGYPSDIITDEITGRKIRICNNNVHPKLQGYYQFGVGYYNKIRAFLNGLI